MINLEKEWPLILETSLSYGVDPFFILSIRYTENGTIGKEFGVMDPSAKTYSQQLSETCATVRNFIKNKFLMATVYDTVLYKKTFSRLCYNQRFRLSFSEQWAPVGAVNDPDNLNANWFVNNDQIYNKLCTEGVTIA